MTHGSVAALVTSLWSFNFPFPPADVDNNLEIYSHQGWRTLGQESARHLHSFSVLPLTLLTSSPMLQSHGVLRVVLAMPHFHTVILEASLLTTKLTYCSSNLEVQAMNSCLHLVFNLYSCHPTHRYYWLNYVHSLTSMISISSISISEMPSLSEPFLPALWMHSTWVFPLPSLLTSPLLQVGSRLLSHHSICLFMVLLHVMIYQYVQPSLLLGQMLLRT